MPAECSNTAHATDTVSWECVQQFIKISKCWMLPRHFGDHLSYILIGQTKRNQLECCKEDAKLIKCHVAKVLSTSFKSVKLTCMNSVWILQALSSSTLATSKCRKQLRRARNTNYCVWIPFELKFHAGNVGLNVKHTTVLYLYSRGWQRRCSSRPWQRGWPIKIRLEDWKNIDGKKGEYVEKCENDL